MKGLSIGRFSVIRLTITNQFTLVVSFHFYGILNSFLHQVPHLLPLMLGNSHSQLLLSGFPTIMYYFFHNTTVLVHLILFTFILLYLISIFLAKPARVIDNSCTLLRSQHQALMKSRHSKKWIGHVNKGKASRENPQDMPT